MKTLILIESPNKARAVAQHVRHLLSEDVLVRSTAGHLRDLPPDGLGVDVQAGFIPQYQIRKPKSVAYLRPAIRQADRILLAMDPDREGEAIAWHVTRIFAPELEGKIVQRVTFSALTRQAIADGLNHPRGIDQALVQAALARRVIDRLIGYQVSPRLWAAMKAHGKNFAAGRVQIAALALLAEASGQWQLDFDWTD